MGIAMCCVESMKLTPGIGIASWEIESHTARTVVERIGNQRPLLAELRRYDRCLDRDRVRAVVAERGQIDVAILAVKLQGVAAGRLTRSRLPHRPDRKRYAKTDGG